MFMGSVGRKYKKNSQALHFQLIVACLMPHYFEQYETS